MKISQKYRDISYFPRLSFLFLAIYQLISNGGTVYKIDVSSSSDLRIQRRSWSQANEDSRVIRATTRDWAVYVSLFSSSFSNLNSINYSSIQFAIFDPVKN